MSCLNARPFISFFGFFILEIIIVTLARTDLARRLDLVIEIRLYIIAGIFVVSEAP